MVVLFSKTGSYLILSDGYAGLANWKWNNEEETGLYYSWGSWDDRIITIDVLTSNSLVLHEDVGLGATYTYYLVPKN